jgi:hypothetical protein
MSDLRGNEAGAQDGNQPVGSFCRATLSDLGSSVSSECGRRQVCATGERSLAAGFSATVWSARFGAFNIERYFLPTVPDTDLHVGSLGVGYKGENWTWSAAVQLIAGNWRTINDNVNPTVNGRYKLLTPTLALSAGYHF